MHNSHLPWPPVNQGPKLLPQNISLPIFLLEKDRHLERLNKIASLSLAYLPGDSGDDHEAEVYPPIQSPFLILKSDIVGPLLSQRE